MLNTVAATYRCPFLNTASCITLNCAAYRETKQGTEGYCKFVGDVVRVVPELTVEIGNKNIIDGDSYAFGSKEVNTITFVELKLSNTGSGILKFTGTPDKVTMTGDTTDFTFVKSGDLLQEETIPDGVQILKIRFKPLSTGLKTATISIASNDLDNTPLTVDFSGTGI